MGMISRRRLILSYTTQQVIPNSCTKFQNPRFGSSWEIFDEKFTHTHKHCYGKDNKTCHQTGKLTCNCAFPLWSILESYIYAYQTWFKSIKGFAETDTVKIKLKKFKVRDLDLKAM